MDVCNTDPIDQKFESFGWAVKHVDGHDYQQLKETFASMPFEAGKPSLIIAHTVKGKGVSYMEDQLKWHHGVPSEQEYETALKELDAVMVSLN